MPTVLWKSEVFDVVEGVLTPPQVTLDHQDALAVLVSGDTAGPAKLLQLSASLIRVSQVMWDNSAAQPQQVTYEWRLSGSGIRPVSTIDALMDAINYGLAKGTLSKLEILQTSTNADISLLTLTLDDVGYHLTSGDISVVLAGRLPISFTQFADIGALFDSVAEIDTLTNLQRTALFKDLSAYAVDGLTLSEAGHVLFDVHVAATTASLTYNGLTLTATGTFPDNLGEDMQIMWNLFQQKFGDGPVTPIGFPGLSITALTLTDAAGHVLGSMDDPLADTPTITKVDGRIYDVVEAGSNGNDDMWHATARHEKVALAGLGGRDHLEGGYKSDDLLGGSGNDTMVGNAGADRLDGGGGRDVMTGGAGADVFHFDLGDGFDLITDLTAGEDVIQILDATRKSDLTFTQVGDDVQIDYRTIHILVQHHAVAQMDHVVNFEF